MHGSFKRLFPGAKAVIGMIHLPPLPGYAGSPGIDDVVAQAVADAATLAACGFDGALVENEYDRPHSVEASAATVASMTTATLAAVRAAPAIKVGCEILLNDPKASLQVAYDAGATFIRSDYFVDSMTRPEYGEFAIDPDSLLAHRDALGADDVLILADIQVKYATMLRPRPLAESAALACDKGADAIVVTGTASGDAPLLDHLTQAMKAAEAYEVPVLAGSGVNEENVARVLECCDGAIIGTALMRDKRLSTERAGALMNRIGRASS